MRRGVRLAAQRGVSVGAHASYPDLRGFGGHDLDVPSEEISDDVLYQIGALEAMARAAGTRVAYEAARCLYNRRKVDEVVSRAVIDGVVAFDAELPLLAPHGWVALSLARKTRVTGFAEGVADRAYDGDGCLVSRRLPGAMIHDPQVVAERAVQMALHIRRTGIDGRLVTVRVESLRVHGDTPGAKVYSVVTSTPCVIVEQSLTSSLRPVGSRLNQRGTALPLRENCRVTSIAPQDRSCPAARRCACLRVRGW
jgi:5-oxoprolinase (ATP-hydrolysing) subunit A